MASAIQQDTAKPEESEKVVKYAVATYGALHYAVNNAGVGGAHAPAGETDIAEWNRESPGHRARGARRPPPIGTAWPA